MKHIELKSGFTFEHDENRLNNMELVDVLEEAEGENPLVVSKLVTLLLGKEDKKALYDHLRTDDGLVPIESVTDAVKEIFEAYGDKGKN